MIGHSAEDGSIPVVDMSYDERAKSIGLRTIDSAPRDGTAIVVTAEDEPLYEMSWNQFGSNDLVQTERGIWWGKDGAFTWSEKHGHGPTHWAPLNHPMIAILKAKAQGEGGQRKTPPCTAGLPEVAEQNWPEAQSSPTPSGIKIRIDEPFTQATPYDKTLTPTTPPDGEGR